jgi:hypothetical protein
VNHGGLDTKPRHVGDLGNIGTADNGVTEFEIESGLSLSGPYSIIGKGGLRGRQLFARPCSVNAGVQGAGFRV